MQKVLITNAERPHQQLFKGREARLNARKNYLVVKDETGTEHTFWAHEIDTVPIGLLVRIKAWFQR